VSSYFDCLGYSLVCPSDTPDWNQCIPANMKRRDPRIWHMAYSAAHKVINDTGIKPNSIITGTALGALDETKNFLDTVYDTGFGNPRHFIASVHNSMAGKIALEFQIKGPNITVCEGQNSLASSLVMLESLNESDFPAIVILIDEHIELLDRLQPSFSSLCKDYLKPGWKDGAFALIADKHKSGCKSQIRAFPPIPRTESIQSSINSIALKNIPDYTDEILLESCSTSYLQPGISTFESLSDSNLKRVLIGSYSPASDSVAIIEVVNKCFSSQA
jgi:hypothetical protein